MAELKFPSDATGKIIFIEGDRCSGRTTWALRILRQWFENSGDNTTILRGCVISDAEEARGEYAAVVPDNWIWPPSKLNNLAADIEKTQRETFAQFKRELASNSSAMDYRQFVVVLDCNYVQISSEVSQSLIKLMDYWHVTVIVMRQPTSKIKGTYLDGTSPPYAFEFDRWFDFKIYTAATKSKERCIESIKDGYMVRCGLNEAFGSTNGEHREWYQAALAYQNYWGPNCWVHPNTHIIPLMGDNFALLVNGRNKTLAIAHI